jgi:hypothetical protein
VRKKIWWWITTSFGESYNGDVLQHAKQLFSLKLPQMTKYVKNRQNYLAMHGGHRNDTAKERICPSLMMSGPMAVASSETKDSPPPLIMDVIPAHSQTKFDKESGISAKLNPHNVDISKHIITHCLETCSAILILGKDILNTLFKVIEEMICGKL